MKKEKKWHKGFTWVGYLNFIILQWFFIRLSYRLKKSKKINFKIMKGIIPLTGWWNEYKYLKTEEV